MKLVKLPSGVWIEAGTVYTIEPRYLGHIGDHCAVHARDQQHIVPFSTPEDARIWAGKFAELVNGSEAPSSASSGSTEDYPIEHDCWVVYEEGVFEPNRDLGYFWNECEAWCAAWSDLRSAAALSEDFPEELSKETLRELGWRVVRARLLTQNPNEDPSS